jgi:hypothetical protein
MHAQAQSDWTQFGVRPLGMGNAFVAVSDDFNALYYNPAGLARIKEWQIEIINPKFNISTNTYFLAKNIKSKGKMDVSDVLDTFKDAAGKPNHIGIGFTPYYIFPGFGVGIAIDSYASFIPHSGNVDIETLAISQLRLPIAFASNFFSNRLSLGASVKLNAIGGFDQDISMDTISLISSSSSDKKSNNKKITDYLISGMGIGLDLGLLFTPTETMEPTFGMSITDFGGTPMRKQLISKGTKAKAIPPSVNTGVSFKPFKTANNYILVALDTQMINQDSHFAHKIGFGVEWGLYKILKIEAGMLHGYPTAGLQFDVNLLKIRLATYAVDRSPVVGLEKDLADRRVALQIKILI